MSTCLKSLEQQFAAEALKLTLLKIFSSICNAGSVVSKEMQSLQVSAQMKALSDTIRRQSEEPRTLRLLCLLSTIPSWTALLYGV